MYGLEFMYTVQVRVYVWVRVYAVKRHDILGPYINMSK